MVSSLMKYLLKLGTLDSHELTGKWCHVSPTSFSHTLDLDPNVNSLGPTILCELSGLLDFKVENVRE